MSFLLWLAAASAAPLPLACPDGKYESGCDARDVAARISAAPDRLVSLHNLCLYDYGARCWVEASGRIRGVERGPELAWQKLLLAPEDGPTVAMVVLVALDGSKSHVIGFAESSGIMAPPDLVDTNDEQSLIHIRATLAGSGAGNGDALFIDNDRGPGTGWRRVDLTRWREDAGAMLPDGFDLHGPARFSFTEMIAVVPVARPGDGNCCPSGGEALFDLAVEDDRLVVIGMNFQPMATAGDIVRAGR